MFTETFKNKDSQTKTIRKSLICRFSKKNFKKKLKQILESAMLKKIKKMERISLKKNLRSTQ